MIQDSVNRISYDGNGIATEFAFPFSITTTNDVKVMLVDGDTETILTADYYVDEANSKVDYPGYPPGEEPLPELQPPVLADGQRIVIYRELDVTQLTSLFDQYPFKTIEVMVDKTTILLQQLLDAQQRALTLSVSTGTDVSLILPAPSANKSFRWNAAGTGLETTLDPASVIPAVTSLKEATETASDTAVAKAGEASASAGTATEKAIIATEQANLAKGYADSIDPETFNAATADKLSTARTIAGASFDGSTAIDISYNNLTDKPTLPAIATQAQAIAGTDDATIITPAKLRNGLNASSDAPIYACRTWVNFNGTGTVAIRASGNVSSITDNGTGDYTVNFATDMQDENYVLVSGGNSASLSKSAIGVSLDVYAQTVSSASFNTQLAGASGYNSNGDAAKISLGIFR